MNVRYATGPQVKFVKSLLEQRVVDQDAAARLLDKIEKDILTAGDASNAIGFLKAQPYVARKVVDALAVDDEADEPGVYEVNGTVFQVKWNKIKTHLYSFKLVDGKDWEYAGAIYKNKIAKTDRISVERAIELSALRGSCIRCNRVLKAEKSVRDGIGPICIQYFS